MAKQGIISLLFLIIIFIFLIKVKVIYDIIVIEEKIITTAKIILETRKKYLNATLGELYSEKMYLYSDLLKAHQLNDRAVMGAYNFPVKNTFKESDCVA